MSADHQPKVFISSKETGRRTTLSNQTRLRKEREGTFPERICLGPRTVVYVEAEVEEWIRSRLRAVGRTVKRGERRLKAEQKSLIGHNGGPALLEASPSPAAVAARATE